MAEITESDLRKNPLMQTMGFVRISPGEPEPQRISLEFEAKLEQCHSGNIVQGGFVTGWIDSAMAHVLMRETNFEKLPLSLDIKIAFLRAAHPGIVVAEAWIELLGRRTAFVEGLLRTPDGEVIAKGMSTVMLKSMKR